jgi:hypothetical protein
MKISIIGSWREGDREWGLRGSHADFEQACLALGRELGRHRQVVIVGGQSASTADLHVVRGMVDGVRHQEIKSPLIEVLRPAGDSSSYETLARENPGVFAFHVPTQARWAEAHLLSMREASVVIAIAGEKGTYQAGLAAIVAKKKLVPISSFGGAAAKLSVALESIGELNSQGDHRYLNGPWNQLSLATVVKLVGLGRPPKVLLIHGHSDDWLRVRDWLQKTRNQEVVVMQQEFRAGRTLPEKFEQLAAQVDVAIAIATPDDVGRSLKSKGSSKRARQNVWLEVGWFWGRLGRDRILVLSRGEIELPSDLSGIEYHEYQKNPVECADQLRSFMGIT